MTGVRLRAAGEDYALPVEEVLEVLELRDVTPVAGAPPAVLGVHVAHGQLLPVIDLAALLGVGGDTEPRQIVVAEQDDRRVGLAVERVLEVAEMPEASQPVESDRLRAAVLVDGALVGVVDLAAVLRAAEAEVGG